MPDVFDTITVAPPKGDVFDTLPQKDVFDQVADNSQALAVTHGILRGGISVSAGWATAAAGDASGLNEAISAFTGPAAPATLAGLNILEFLGGSLLADRGVKTGEKAVAQYSQTMRDLQDASKEHPLADQIGAQIPMLPFGLRSAKGYMDIVREAEDASAAVKAVTSRAGGGALAGAGLEAVRPHLDNAINQVGLQMGFKPDEVEQPSIKSFIENAAIGAALNGAFTHRGGGLDASGIRENAGQVSTQRNEQEIGTKESSPNLELQTQGPSDSRPGQVTTVSPQITNLRGAIDGVVKASLPTDIIEPSKDPAIGRFGSGKGLVKSTFERIIGKWSQESQNADAAAKRYGDVIDKLLPDKNRRRAVYVWADAKGDEDLIRQAVVDAPADTKKGYEDALTLTNHEKAVGQEILDGYKTFLARGQDAGVLKEAVEGYLKRVVTKRPTGVEEDDITAHLRDPRLMTNLPEARKRFWESMLDAEKQGIRYEKDIRGASLYAQNLGRTIANKNMVRRMLEAKDDQTGLPIVLHEGTGVPVEPKEQNEPGALLIKGSSGARPPGVAEKAQELLTKNPNWSPEKAESIAKAQILNQYTKVPVSQFQGYKYVHSLEDGTPVMVKGDVLVLKKHANFIKNKFARDRVEALDKLLRVQRFIKGSKLSLSLFHGVHERVNAAGHLTNSFNMRSVEELLKLPEIQYGLQNGAQFVSSAHEGALLEEAMAAHGWPEMIPGIGQYFKAYKDSMFEDRIPRMKMEMYLNALARNKAKYPQLNEEQLATLTGKESTATFGEQNYRTMGAGGGVIGDLASSPKFWQGMQLLFLAPDFGLSKVQHIGQAFTRYGGEQRMAIGVVAAGLYTMSRLMNKWLDDDYHFEPENALAVVVGNRRYTLRSLPGDLAHLFQSPRSYVYHRLSPIVSTALEGMLKRDFQGRPVEWADVVKDAVLQPVPIPAVSTLERLYDGITGKPATRYTLKDQLASALGLSPGLYIYDTEVKKLATKWKEGTGNPKLMAEVERNQASIYPPSDYLNMRDALANGNIDEARKEYARLIKLKGNGVPSVGSKKVSDAMHRWETGAFTGSKRTEAEFIKSLSPEQRRLYDEAVNERKRVYSEFNEMRRTTTRTILDALTGGQKPFSIRDTNE